MVLIYTVTDTNQIERVQGSRVPAIVIGGPSAGFGVWERNGELMAHEDEHYPFITAGLGSTF